jgi:hypothetical protein
MRDPFVVGTVVSIIRLVCWLARERWRGRTMEALVRAAEPGSTVLDRRPDGSLLAVYTRGERR